MEIENLSNWYRANPVVDSQRQYLQERVALASWPAVAWVPGPRSLYTDRRDALVSTKGRIQRLSKSRTQASTRAISFEGTRSSRTISS